MYRSPGAASAVVLVSVLSAVAPYSDGPPPAHTGGFGEPSCHSCHFDNPLNGPETSLSLDGLPERFEPGETYVVSIRVNREGMRAAGFQAATRFFAGADSGKQAGKLRLANDEDPILVSSLDGIEYASHAESALDPGTPQREWLLEWVAPTRPDRVAFHTAANAANGDESELGDFIVLTSRILEAEASPDTLHSRGDGDRP